MSSRTVFPLLVTFFMLFTAFIDATKIVTKRVCQNETLKMTCLQDQGIEVKKALFGRLNATFCHNPGKPEGFCPGSDDALNYIIKKCQYKKTCSIKHGDSLEDTCPRISKYLEVEYTCCRTDGIIKSETACKHQYQPLTISCEGATNGIKIHDAVYGRGRCPPQNTNSQIILFGKNDAADYVSEQCDGKETCSMTSSQLFGIKSDNAGYLVVSYQCP